MTHLAAAIITLRPLQAGPVPGWTGPQTRTWLLDQIGRHDPALAEALNAGSGPRPYTVSSLLGTRRAGGSQGRLTPEARCWLRVTTLYDALTGLLTGQVLPDLPGQQMTLGEQTFAIEGATVDSAADPGAGTTTDAALIQEHTLRPGALARRLELVFSSPVTFRAASGEPVLFPLPELVFGSLLARWNAFCDIHLPEETRRYVAECMGVSRFRLRTQAVTLPLGGREIEQHGFTGQCRFVFLRGDRYWRGLVWSLAAYSFYAGVGQSTALGLGRTRLDSRPAVAVGDS